MACSTKSGIYFSQGQKAPAAMTTARKILSKHTSDGSKWKSVFSWNSLFYIVKTQSKFTFWWKAHDERIDVRSFSTDQFGLRSHMRLTFSKKLIFLKIDAHKNMFLVMNQVDIQCLHFEKCILHEIARSSDLDYSWGLKHQNMCFFIACYWF